MNTFELRALSALFAKHMHYCTWFVVYLQPCCTYEHFLITIGYARCLQAPAQKGGEEGSGSKVRRDLLGAACEQQHFAAAQAARTLPAGGTGNPCLACQNNPNQYRLHSISRSPLMCRCADAQRHCPADGQHPPARPEGADGGHQGPPPGSLHPGRLPGLDPPRGTPAPAHVGAAREPTSCLYTTPVTCCGTCLPIYMLPCHLQGTQSLCRFLLPHQLLSECPVATTADQSWLKSLFLWLLQHKGLTTLRADHGPTAPGVTIISVRAGFRVVLSTLGSTRGPRQRVATTLEVELQGSHFVEEWLLSLRHFGMRDEAGMAAATCMMFGDVIVEFTPEVVQ